jgi:hypothetical protein
MKLPDAVEPVTSLIDAMIQMEVEQLSDEAVLLGRLAEAAVEARHGTAATI